MAVRVRWPWTTRPPEIRESYTDVIQTALYDHAVGSLGKPPPQETTTVLACCRLCGRCRVFVRRRACRSAAPTSCLPLGGGSVCSAISPHGLKARSIHTVDRYRRLPSGWYATETIRAELTARAVVAPTDFLLIQLPGKRAPWRSSGAEALAALDRALAVDSGKPVGLIVGSGLEGALDHWQPSPDSRRVPGSRTSRRAPWSFRTASPRRRTWGLLPNCLKARPTSAPILWARSSIPTASLGVCF